MKRLLFLTFYFKPDLCAGSFRNSSLFDELKSISDKKNINVDVITTMPNRYSTYYKNANNLELSKNIKIHRIDIPNHKSGFIDQIFSFTVFFYRAVKISKKYNYDLVYASSSRLFTAFLGFYIARLNKSKLYLDIRDLFIDTINDVIPSKILKFFFLPFLNFIEKTTFNYATHINLISPGFYEYFKKYNKKNITFFTNGIDEIFLNNKFNNIYSKKEKYKIIYAGNIGEGQGLHKIIPKAALNLREKYEFVIVGDGGQLSKLKKKVYQLKINNVKFLNPVSRDVLIEYYNNSDILFIHLNDYDAFKRVLPSKIFELASYKKPILAGLSGYSKKFLNSEISHSYVFQPCNVKDMVEKISLINFEEKISRTKFINKYNRSKINNLMAKSIIKYL